MVSSATPNYRIVSIVSLIMIVIREVLPENAPEISELSYQLGYPIYGEETIQNIVNLRQSKHDEAFVAIQEQKIIGWIGVSYKISLESPPLCEIHGLVVNEQYRNRGVGKILIKKAQQWTRDKGINKLRLRCNIKRADAILFYQNYGFNEVKQQKVFEIKF